MSWYFRYRRKDYFRSSLWLAPALSIVAAIAFANGVRFVATQIDWVFTVIGPDGARAVLAAYIASSLSFIVFVFSLLLLSVQLAS